MKRLVIRMGITVTLLVVVLWLSDLSAVWDKTRRIGIVTLLGCIMALCLAQLISAVRWMWILRERGARIPFKDLFASYLAGMFVNNFLPTGIGGDVLKAYDIHRLTGNTSLAVGSVFLERLSGLGCLVITSWVGVFFIASISPSYIIVSWMVINVLCFLAIFAIINRAWMDWVAARLDTWGFGRISKGALRAFEQGVYLSRGSGFLPKLMVASVPIQLIVILVYYELAMRLGICLPFASYLFLVPVITIIALLPISLGGLGVREGATVVMFSSAGVTVNDAVSLSLMFMGTLYLVSLIGGVVLLVRYPRLKISGMRKELQG